MVKFSDSRRTPAPDGGVHDSSSGAHADLCAPQHPKRHDSSFTAVPVLTVLPAAKTPESPSAFRSVPCSERPCRASTQATGGFASSRHS